MNEHSRSARSPRWIAVGVVSALVTDAAIGSRAPRHRLLLHSVGLVTAAAIYPALHSEGRADPAERLREVIGVAACAIVARRAAHSRGGSRLLAGGWAAHALFDAMHHRSESSLLPDWYPAACAGYDLAIAASLAVPDRARQKA